MNFNIDQIKYLLDKQSDLDEAIRQEKGISIRAWREDMEIEHEIALHVEVGEFINECRDVWKYWKEKPVDVERVDKDGYVLIKVEEPNVWMHKSRKIWQDAGRELPDGHTLMFSDGDRSNVTLDNLLLVSRGQLAIANKNKLFHKDKSLNESVLKYIDLKIAVSKKKKELGI